MYVRACMLGVWALCQSLAAPWGGRVVAGVLARSPTSFLRYSTLRLASSMWPRHLWWPLYMSGGDGRRSPNSPAQCSRPLLCCLSVARATPTRRVRGRAAGCTPRGRRGDVHYKLHLLGQPSRRRPPLLPPTTTASQSRPRRHGGWLWHTRCRGGARQACPPSRSWATLVVALSRLYDQDWSGRDRHPLLPARGTPKHRKRTPGGQAEPRRPPP